MTDQGWGAPPGGGGWGAPPQGLPGQGPPPPAGAPLGPPKTQNQLAIASLVAGAVSVLSTLCCCIPIVGMVAYLVVPLAGLAAVVTGALAMQEANKTGLGKTESIAGIALGSIGVLIGLVGIAILVLYGGLLAYGAASH